MCGLGLCVCSRGRVCALDIRGNLEKELTFFQSANIW